MFDKFADWVPLGRDGETWRLSTVIDDREDLRDPVGGRGPDHILMAAARKLSRPEEIVLSHSSDGKRKAP